MLSYQCNKVFANILKYLQIVKTRTASLSKSNQWIQIKFTNFLFKFAKILDFNFNFVFCRFEKQICVGKRSTHIWTLTLRIVIMLLRFYVTLKCVPSFSVKTQLTLPLYFPFVALLDCMCIFLFSSIFDLCSSKFNSNFALRIKKENVKATFWFF